MAGLLSDIRDDPDGACYVALGSSFAAGLGLGSRAPGSPLVSRRGTGGYPRRLARLLDVPSFADRTSSGATVRQVVRGGQFWLGPQVDAIGPDTRLVTLTAGGNDVGYVGDLFAASLRNRGGPLGAAARAFTEALKPASARDFAGLGAAFDEALDAIARRSPRARIVVVTYPAILPEAGACSALGLSDAEAGSMRGVADALARTTRDAAVRARATLVDVAALSRGHDACAAEPWVNGARPTAGAPFHPNAAGARATAQAIAEALGRGGGTPGPGPS